LPERKLRNTQSPWDKVNLSTPRSLPRLRSGWLRGWCSGQIVPVEISLLPTSICYHAGEQLSVMVQGYNLIDLSAMLPGIAAAPMCNRGVHIIHTGGKYDSHLLVPVIPP
jgi:predicted acyl esterase